ncbi:MAG TPA: DUF3306 domain-containing protein [Usitatibacter sp.]|nr:DUF3306 domain-containing protein [Usitatibacter sp.]
MSERDEGFLARWSRRKIEARSAPAVEVDADAAARPAEPAPTGGPAAALALPVADEPSPLPPVDSLTPDSDFAPFMRPGVDPATKGEALKALFSDPARYAMDGLDVYIDDYTKPDPLPQGWLEKLNPVAGLHDEPAPKAPAREPSCDSPGESPCAVTPAAQPGVARELDTSAPPGAQPDSMNRGAT